MKLLTCHKDQPETKPAAWECFSPHGSRLPDLSFPCQTDLYPKWSNPSKKNITWQTSGYKEGALWRKVATCKIGVLHGNLRDFEGSGKPQILYGKQTQDFLQKIANPSHECTCWRSLKSPTIISFSSSSPALRCKFLKTVFLNSWTPSAFKMLVRDRLAYKIFIYSKLANRNSYQNT